MQHQPGQWRSLGTLLHAEASANLLGSIVGSLSLHASAGRLLLSTGLDGNAFPQRPIEGCGPKVRLYIQTAIGENDGIIHHSYTICKVSAPKTDQTCASRLVCTPCNIYN